MITLAQANVGMADKVDQMVIDEFRRGSLLLDMLQFDNAVSPGTGGSTLAYGYVRLKTPATAAFRPINTEYTPQEAIREQHTAYCKIFGGSFQLDRVIINTSGAVDELAFQMKEKVNGAINLFHNTVINGDMAVNVDEFDGLDTILTGSSTEYNTGSTLDLSTSAMMTANYNEALDMIEEFVSGMQGRPHAFLMNSTLKTKIKGIARRAGYYTRLEDAFGRSVDAWDNIPLIDLENFYNPATNTTTPTVPIVGGKTSMFAVQIAQDAFHGISPIGNAIISTALPDLNAPGVVKMGDVEMVAGVVLKNSLKSGVFRNIAV
jgi:hypothetical protein